MNIERKRVHEKLAKIDALMDACPELDLIRYNIDPIESIMNSPRLIFHKENSDQYKVLALLGSKEWDYVAEKDGSTSMVQKINGVEIELYKIHTSPVMNQAIAAAAFAPAP